MVAGCDFPFSGRVLLFENADVEAGAAGGAEHQAP